MGKLQIQYTLIREDYNNGISINKIKKKYSCSYLKVRNAIGDEINNKKNLIPLDKQYKLIREDYNKGMSIRDIRVKYSCSYLKVKNAIGDDVRSNSESVKLAHKLKPESFLHTEETKKKISKKLTINNKGGRCKWYEVSGQKVQGKWEKELAELFTYYNIKWNKIKTNSHTFEYKSCCGKIKNYTPDFYLEDFDMYIEVKGYWWGNDKNKMQEVLKNNNINIKILEDRRLFIYFIYDLLNIKDSV
jgi:Mor family transcriptional regulator